MEDFSVVRCKSDGKETALKYVFSPFVFETNQQKPNKNAMEITFPPKFFMETNCHFSLISNQSYITTAEILQGCKFNFSLVRHVGRRLREGYDLLPFMPV